MSWAERVRPLIHSMSEDDVMNVTQVRVWLVIVMIVGMGQPLVCGQAIAESEQDRIAQGKRVYVKHCAGCHGAEGEGDGYKMLGPEPADLTSPSRQKKSDATLLKTIHEGKPNMPSWKVLLSEEDSRDVLEYIRTLAK